MAMPCACRLPRRYWLALSEIIHGQAVVGLVKPGAQPRSVQGRLRLIAIGHFVTAARFGEFINRKVRRQVEPAFTAPLVCIVPVVNTR